jgi:enediyne biosynthesis protein E3
MIATLAIIGVALACAALAKYWHVLFRLNPRRIDLEKLGLWVKTPEHRRRVKDILTAFYGGFNAMAAGEVARTRAVCDSFPPLLRPFAYEGAAVGFSLRATLTPRAAGREFEAVTEQLGAQYFLMYHIGVGFWCGIAYRFFPSRVPKVAGRLDPFYKELCYDGFGFKLGLFHYARDRRVVEKFLHFDGHARHACFQGFGRSLWFLFMDAPRSIDEHVARMDAPYRDDCYSGVGLAAAFTNMDDLGAAFRLAEDLEPQYRAPFFLGVTIAAYTRRTIDDAYLGQCLARLGVRQREIVSGGLESCDRHFSEVAARGVESPYEEWRRHVSLDLEALLSRQAAPAFGGASYVG